MVDALAPMLGKHKLQMGQMGKHLVGGMSGRMMKHRKKPNDQGKAAVPERISIPADEELDDAYYLCEVPSVHFKIYAITAYRVCTANPQDVDGDTWTTLTACWEQELEIAYPISAHSPKAKSPSIKGPTGGGGPGGHGGKAWFRAKDPIVEIGSVLQPLPVFEVSRAEETGSSGEKGVDAAALVVPATAPPSKTAEGATILEAPPSDVDE
mmetsp:Transcript_5604/g.12769  ORF Transcript_5604/g.12769 Transcript_5604/m.12769 type:complete len:210 (-) Transcript_5604:2242-2871(-)